MSRININNIPGAEDDETELPKGGDRKWLKRGRYSVDPARYRERKREYNSEYKRRRKLKE